MSFFIWRKGCEGAGSGLQIEWLCRPRWQRRVWEGLSWPNQVDWKQGAQQSVFYVGECLHVGNHLQAMCDHHTLTLQNRSLGKRWLACRLSCGLLCFLCGKCPAHPNFCPSCLHRSLAFWAGGFSTCGSIHTILEWSEVSRNIWNWQIHQN